MKAILIAGTATAALLAAAPALAQSTNYGGVSYYANLGYTNVSPDGGGSPDFSAITGRLGARIGPFLGVEGEASGGLNSDHVNLGGSPADVRLNDEYAIYGVGFLPIAPNTDLFARIGYGATDFHTDGPGYSFHSTDNSWNFGAGGQYFFDRYNGVRLDYTRYDYDSGPDANVWGVSYVRRF